MFSKNVLPPFSGSEEGNKQQAEIFWFPSLLFDPEDRGSTFHTARPHGVIYTFQKTVLENHLLQKPAANRAGSSSLRYLYIWLRYSMNRRSDANMLSSVK
jgi:hypothetical protein